MEWSDEDVDMTDEDEFSEEDIDYGRRFVMDWEDFVEASTTLPDYEVRGRNIIFLLLGYLPPTEAVYLPYEPYLRTLCLQYDEARLSKDRFLEDIDTIVKNIRNDDLKKHGFSGKEKFTAADYAYYHTHLALHKEAAKQRLSILLGHEPLIEHSLYAETHLRQLMLEDYYHHDLLLDKVDHRSFTIYHYHKTYIEEGCAAADASPLVRIGENRT